MLYRIIAWIVLLGSFVGSVIMMLDEGVEGVGILVAGIVLFIGLLAVSEIIKVVIDIEHNIRKAAENKEEFYSFALTCPFCFD